MGRGAGTAPASGLKKSDIAETRPAPGHEPGSRPANAAVAPRS